ncbi:MAG TPA: PAS domain S-box protein [Candidatus Limnocylindria bacterium]|nr:PAS domain S-box protein [Candidatus Limnocylindria bacterium]
MGELRPETAALYAALVDATDNAVLSTDLDGVITSWNRGAERMFGYTADQVVGLSIDRLIPHGSPHEFDALMERLSSGERVEHAPTVRVRQDGARIDVLESASPILRGGSLAGALLLIADASATLVDRRRAEALDAYERVAAVVATTADPIEIANVALAEARALLRSDEALLRWYEPSTGRLRMVAATETARRPDTIAPGEGATGQAFERRAPVLVEDYGGWSGALTTAPSTGVRAVLAVPLMLGSRALGALTVYRREARAYTETDVRLLTIFASEITALLELGNVLARVPRPDGAARR